MSDKKKTRLSELLDKNTPQKPQRLDIEQESAGKSKAYISNMSLTKDDP